MQKLEYNKVNKGVKHALSLVYGANKGACKACLLKISACTVYEILHTKPLKYITIINLALFSIINTYIICCNMLQGSLT